MNNELFYESSLVEGTEKNMRKMRKEMSKKKMTSDQILLLEDGSSRIRFESVPFFQ